MLLLLQVVCIRCDDLIRLETQSLFKHSAPRKLDSFHHGLSIHITRNEDCSSRTTKYLATENQKTYGFLCLLFSVFHDETCLRMRVFLRRVSTVVACLLITLFRRLPSLKISWKSRKAAENCDSTEIR